MFRRILVPVDGSDTSNEALLVAIGLARESGGQLFLVHVLEQLAHVPRAELTSRLRTEASEAGMAILLRALAVADAAEVPAQTRLLEPAGRLGECVAEAARRWSVDLIVVGRHGRRGVRSALLGSGAEQVVRLARVPVLVVPARTAA